MGWVVCIHLEVIGLVQDRHEAHIVPLCAVCGHLERWVGLQFEESYII